MASTSQAGAPEGREPVPVDRTAADLARSGKITPMLRQYLEVKGEHTDCMVFFRLGDFYEVFFEDAVAASEILEITLTARGKGEDRFPMAGIPHHAAAAYLGRLVQAGRKVAICEQVEDASQAKGLVRREVVRIITPGMVVDDEVLEAKVERLLATVAPAAQEGGALALLDVSTGAFRAARVDRDDDLADELARAAPAEVLLPEDLPDERAARLTARVAAPVGRGEPDLFEAREGEAVLRRHFEVAHLEGYGIPSGPEGRLLAAAAGAALRYARRTQKQAAVHVDRLQVYRPGDHLVLDDATRANLEILRSAADGKRKGSLLGHVDRTATALGGRCLARWLTWPLREKAAIEARHDAVGQLTERAVLRDDLHGDLREVGDLERLLARLALGQGNARELKSLARSLQVLPRLRERLQQAFGGGAAATEAEAGPDAAGSAASTTDTPRAPALLIDLADGLTGLEDLAAEVDAALVDEPPATTRDGNMFRRGFDKDLDELIELSTSGKDWILRLEATEREATGIGSLKVRYNRIFGYYIEVTRPNLHLVPDHYERRQTTANAERFVTPDLRTYEEKVLTAEDKRKALEQRLFEELRARVLTRAVEVRAAAGRVGELDALLSFAKVAADAGWCRPELDESVCLEIDDGRHPVVEEALRRAGGEPFVPNDLRLTGEQFLMVITGPNMAGKSTVMRQVALLVVLAQAGSFVPARRARVGLCDRVFTRVGASDNLARGQSTFMVEMTETAAILNHATERSLVVLDEIGRGTSTYDGVSIAWAVAEDLHDRIRCRTLFATHYHELTDLSKERPGVVNHTVAVKEWNGQVVFLRKLVPGAANRSYGIQVARLAGLPPAVLDRAGEVLANLEQVELDDLGHPALARSARRAGEGAGEAGDPGQLSLFGGARRPSEVDRRLSEVDPDALTPRQALELLYELKGLGE